MAILHPDYNPKVKKGKEGFKLPVEPPTDALNLLSNWDEDRTAPEFLQELAQAGFKIIRTR